MDNQSTIQNSQGNQLQNPPIGQTKVDIFSLDKEMNGLLDSLKKDREILTKTFDQNRSAVRLLADIFGNAKENESPGMDFSRFEHAGVDVAQVLKDKIDEQATLIDKIAKVRGVKSSLAEQFTHYDDRHTGAEAKNELLEDIETQLMSTIYNQINELRGKIDSRDINSSIALNPVQAPQDVNQFTVDSQTKSK